MKTEHEHGVKQIACGHAEDVPSKPYEHCGRLTAAAALKLLDRNDINHVQCQPGMCRFCNRSLPVKTVRLSETWVSGVFQCDHAASLWPEIDKAREERRKRAIAAKEGREHTRPPMYNQSDF